MLSALFAAMGFAVAIVLPNLLLMGLGFLLRRSGQIDQAFVDQASFLVFHCSLPCLLFFSVLSSAVSIGSQLPLIGAGVTVTMLLYLTAQSYANRRIHAPQDRGVFVQGIFRSNMAIIGLATVHNAYGDPGLGIAAVYMGVMTVLFNVLAVLTLSQAQSQSQTQSDSDASAAPTHQATKTTSQAANKAANKPTARAPIATAVSALHKIGTNPLVIALLAAFAYKALKLPMPNHIIDTTGNLLATIALPLALICAGASLNIKDMMHPSGLSMQASLARIVIAPIMAVAVGVALGLTPIKMGILFIMVASPTAAASYVMAKAMGGNEVLAANILAFTSVFSMVGMAVGMALLRGIGWV